MKLYTYFSCLRRFVLMPRHQMGALSEADGVRLPVSLSVPYPSLKNDAY